MKAKSISIRIIHDSIPGDSDYPRNAPLPRIGDFIEMDYGQGYGYVYKVIHEQKDWKINITIRIGSPQRLLDPKE